MDVSTYEEMARRSREVAQASADLMAMLDDFESGVGTIDDMRETVSRATSAMSELAPDPGVMIDDVPASLMRGAKFPGPDGRENTTVTMHLMDEQGQNREVLVGVLSENVDPENRTIRFPAGTEQISFRVNDGPQAGQVMTMGIDQFKQQHEANRAAYKANYASRFKPRQDRPDYSRGAQDAAVPPRTQQRGRQRQGQQQQQQGPQQQGQQRGGYRQQGQQRQQSQGQQRQGQQQGRRAATRPAPKPLRSDLVISDVRADQVKTDENGQYLRAWLENKTNSNVIPYKVDLSQVAVEPGASEGTVNIRIPAGTTALRMPTDDAARALKADGTEARHFEASVTPAEFAQRFVAEADVDPSQRRLRGEVPRPVEPQVVDQPAPAAPMPGEQQVIDFDVAYDDGMPFDESDGAVAWADVDAAADVPPFEPPVQSASEAPQAPQNVSQASQPQQGVPQPQQSSQGVPEAPQAPQNAPQSRQPSQRRVVSAPEAPAVPGVSHERVRGQGGQDGRRVASPDVMPSAPSSSPSVEDSVGY